MFQFSSIVRLRPSNLLAALAIAAGSAMSAQATDSPDRIYNHCLNSNGSTHSGVSGTAGEGTNLWLLKISAIEVGQNEVMIRGVDNVYASVGDEWHRFKSTKPLEIRFPTNPSSAADRAVVVECINTARIAMASGIGLTIFGQFRMYTTAADTWGWNDVCTASAPSNSPSAVLQSCGLRSDLLAEKNKWDTTQIP